MGALFMLVRAEDAKQICSLFQLGTNLFPGPSKTPRRFPVLWKQSCGHGRIQHPERHCTNDNISAMFILLLQGGIFFYLFSEP